MATRKSAAQKAAEASPEPEATPSTKQQFPALHDEPAAEVAQRSADGATGQSFEKVFVMLGPVSNDHPVHEENARFVLDEAVQRGLHPTGPATLVRAEEVPEVRGKVSTRLTYAAPVVPAVVDHRASETVTAGSTVPEDRRLGEDKAED